MIQSALVCKVEKTGQGEGFANSSYDLLGAFPLPGWVHGKHSTESLWGLNYAHSTGEGTERGKAGTTSR